MSSNSKFQGCEKCREHNGVIIRNDKDGNPYAYKCKCLEDYQHKLMINLYFKNANLPESIKTYDLSQYTGDDKNKNLFKIKKFIDKFEEKYNNINLYFYGGLGTQKTTLSKYICWELIKKEKSVYYTLTNDLIKLLLNAERDEDAVNKIKKIINYDLLILDEISTDKCTWYKSDYQAPFFTSFLKRRLENICKSTIFISNNSMRKLYESKFGNTIADLINRECSSELIFKDRFTKISDSDIDNIWD